MTMDFQSAMETFAEAWVAATTKGPLTDTSAQSQALALTRSCKTPSPPAPLPVSITNATNTSSSTSSATSANSNNHNTRNESPERETASTPPSPPPPPPQPLPQIQTTSTQILPPTPMPLPPPPPPPPLPPSSSSSSSSTLTLPPTTTLSLQQKTHHPQVSPHMDDQHSAVPPAGAGNITTPQAKDDFDSSKNCTGKSLPVHCVVEAICSLNESRNQNNWRRRPFIETDSYVIIPVGAPFHSLVQAALLRLGYSADSAVAARGSIVIKNWKALNFDQICSDPLVTVGEILGELTSVVTLKIQVFRGRSGNSTDIKDKLLSYLLLQSHGTLMSSGCPLDELSLSQMCRATSNCAPMPEISDETMRKFDHWWASQLRVNSPVARSPFTNSSPLSQPQPKPVDRTVVHPAIQTIQSQFPTQKTRMRTSFDPELELPKLQRWFTENQHPSRQQIQHYVKELNNLDSRRGRKPLDVNNVVYWFKNARAAQKRAEVRNVVPGLQCQVPMNGYSDPSQTNGFMISHDSYLTSDRLSDHRFKGGFGGMKRPLQHSNTSDEFSIADSDIEDEEMSEAPSPSVPLSLTTTVRKSHESRENSPSRPVSVVSNQPSKEEPINYSPTDHTNNNIKTHYSDVEDEEIVDNKHSYESSHPQHPPPVQLSQPPQHYCNSPENQIMARNEGLERLAAGFPLVPNSMFNHSIMYMSHYIPSLAAHASPPGSSSGLSGMSAALSADERRKRNRTFIDPVTEVPRLEQWFALNTHPSHALIVKYTEDLNCMPYRQKFPRLESKNVQFWFKNRRAKCKRLKMSLFDNNHSGGQYHSERD